MVKPALILVHGAWHVPEHYYDFIQSLQNAGYEVFCPRLPTCDQSKRSNTNFLSDTSVVRSQILSLIDDSRDIVMVLHSYGGAVGSEAVQNLSANERATRGLKGGVVRLVYMCGFMLQPGEIGGAASLPRPILDLLEFDTETGTTFLAKPHILLFYADVEPERAKRMDLFVRQSGLALIRHHHISCVATYSNYLSQD